MEKAIVFDMDGTIADLYNVKDWLPMLRAENPIPYEIAKPMFDKDRLYGLLLKFKKSGGKIIVTTWGSKGASNGYTKQVKKVKENWLKRHGFPYDEIHCVKYGTPKTKVSKGKAHIQLLIDDNEEVRRAWSLGKAVHPDEMIEAINEFI